MVQQIINFPVGFGGGRADAKIWKCNPNGVFTVKTAYELLVQCEQWLDPFWKILWKLKIPPKLRFFFMAGLS